MSAQWDPLIERLLAQEIDMDSEEVRAACEDPEFVERLDETLATLAVLDEEAVLAEARAEGAGPLEASLSGLVQHELGTPLRSRRSWLFPLLAAAAAAVLLFAVFSERGERPGPIQPIPMGDEQLQCLSPSGPDSDFSVFRWQNGAPGGTYDVEVYDLDGELVDGGRSGPLGDTRQWQPDPADVETWGTQIEWQLRWQRPGGGRAETVFGAASR